MASGDKKKQSTMSFLVGAIGRAVLSGLAMYGAKKLYDDYRQAGESVSPSEEKPKQDPDMNDECSDNEDEEGGMNIQPSQCPPQNLLIRLEEYLATYVRPDKTETDTACKVVQEVEEYFMEILDRSCPELPLGKLIQTGSVYEDLHVITADDFDVMLPLKMDASQWELIDGCDTLLDAPGYALIKRDNQEFFKVGSVPWDRFLVGHYLSPQKLLQYFQSVLHSSVDPGKKLYTIEPSVKENSLSLTVIYGSDKKLRLNIIPMVKIGDTTVTGQLHPKYERFRIDGYKNLWRRSFRSEEEELLKTFVGCQKDCLRIIKAIGMNEYASPLHLLEPYVFKTILFHLNQMEENWDTEVLAERLIDMFVGLHGFLEQRYLANYFGPNINLFEGYTDIFLRELKNCVNQIIIKNRFAALLKTKCPGKDL